MADLETDQTQDVVETEEAKVEEIKAEETKTEETKTEETKPEDKESGGSFIKRIKDKILGDREIAKTVPRESIPESFTKAARKSGMSDEMTEKFAADFTDEQLEKMIPALIGGATAKADDTSDKVGDTADLETKDEKVEDSQDDDNKLAEALDRIAELEKAQGLSVEKSKEEEQANFVTGASALFDEASKEFEVFGKTDELPRFPHNNELIPTSPQMEARNEVFRHATAIQQAGVMSGDKALEFAMNAYKGANLATETKRNAIKGLKEREQTLGGKRVSHKATEAADLTGPETIAEVRRRHGK